MKWVDIQRFFTVFHYIVHRHCTLQSLLTYLLISFSTTIGITQSNTPVNGMKKHEQLAQHIPFQVAVLSNLMKQSSSDRFVEDSGMAGRDWRVLAIIGLQTITTPNHVASTTGIDKATVSRALKRLSQLQLIKKQPNKDDKRSTWLTLTAEGKRRFDHLMPQMQANGKTYDELLSPGEKSLLLELILRLQAKARTLIDENF